MLVSRLYLLVIWMTSISLDGYHFHEWPIFMFVMHLSIFSLLKIILDVVRLGRPLWTNETCYKSPSIAPLSISRPYSCWIFSIFFSYMWHSLICWWIKLVASGDLLESIGVGVATWLDLSDLGVMLLRSSRRWPRGVFWLVRVTSVSHLVAYK